MKKYIKHLVFALFVVIAVALTGCNFGAVKEGQVSIKTLKSTKDTITFDLAVSGDTDTIGLIDALLYEGDTYIASIDDITQDQLTGHTFIDLETYTEYRLEISYTTGSNNEPAKVSQTIMTAPEDISVSSIKQKESKTIYVGDMVTFVIEFNNEDNVKIESVTVNNEVFDLSKDNVTQSVEVTLPCDFIDDTWVIQVTNIRVRVNNLPIEFKLTSDNSLTVPVKGVLLFSDFRLKDDVTFVKQDENLTVMFSVIGDDFNLYEIDSVKINSKNYSKEEITIEGNDVIVDITLNKEGINTITLQNVVLVKDGITIEAELSEEIEIFVTSTSDIVTINTVDDFLKIDAGSFTMYVINSDLDFKDIEIPSFDNFKGHINGNYHSLSNINLAKSGLFGTNSGVISNLIIESPTLNIDSKSDKTSMGILVNVNKGILRNIYINKATVTSSNLLTNSYLGGIVGTNEGYIYEVSFLGELNDEGENNFIGGISGYNSAEIVDVMSAVNINAINSTSGGIIGSYNDKSVIENSYYFIGQLLISKHLNEFGHAYTYEEMIDINWYYNNLKWQAFDLSYLDLGAYSNDYQLLSKGNPGVISSIMDLTNIGEFGYYILTTDLDYEGINLVPVTNFSGVLDGNGHVVKGINITTSDMQEVGLFATLNGMVINLKFTNSHLTISGKNNSSVGFVAGKAFNAIIDNVIIDSSCSITVNKDGIDQDNVTNYVGSLVGYGQDVVINNSASSVSIITSVDASDNYSMIVVGGLIGYLKNGFVENVATNIELDVNVLGNNASIVYVGGVIGFNSDAILTSVYAQGPITLTSNFNKTYAGGIYGDGSSYGHKGLFFLEGQSVIINGVQVPSSSNILFVSIDEINEYNESQPWGIL